MIIVGIRLAGGEFNYVGRLEIFYNGQWGTVCDDGFNVEAADVACNNLGFGCVPGCFVEYFVNKQ